VKRELWPIGEAAQADYEALRAAALRGDLPGADLAAARFARRGLAGLIAWSSTDPDYLASLVGAERPHWSGREDPREQVLCEVYGLLLGAPDGSTAKLRAVGT
jgi:hypothetical protein